MFKEEAANRTTLGSSFERDWSLAFCFPSEEPVAKPFEARLADMSAEINEYMAVSNAYNMSVRKGARGPGCRERACPLVAVTPTRQIPHQ